MDAISLFTRRVWCGGRFGERLSGDELLYLFNASQPPAVVDDRVTVRTHGPQVFDRIGHVLAPDLGKGTSVSVGGMRAIKRIRIPKFSLGH